MSFLKINSPLMVGFVSMFFIASAALGADIGQTMEPYVYNFAPVDYYVIGAYLLLMSSLGFILKKLCHNSKDYLIGGNKIPWWLAGSSIFMMSFSAWTFTGAAGFAYTHGILIILLFYFNVVAYFVGGRFLAARVRQLRLITFGQILHERFGRLGEQFFVWIQFPNMLFGGAIWLLGLAVFVSVAFGVPMPVTILVTGAVILLYSTLSGSWAVMTSDFLQSVVLMTLSIVIAILTLMKVGGIGGLVEQMEPSHLRIFSDQHSWMWVVAYFSQCIIIFNSILGANRYLAVRDGRSAQKAAYLAAVLFLLGPLVWFVPPMAASFLFPNIAEMLPALQHPNDGAYVLMGLHVLPSGLAGLLVMVIFAATLSSMDTAINVNAGILSMNIYKPLFRPNASDRELFIASRVFNVLCGLIVVLSAYALSKQDGMNLFDLMLLLSAGIGLPLAVPCLLLFIFRKTPPWTAVVSVAAAGIYSYYTVRADWHLFPRVFGIVIIALTVFCISRLFWQTTAADKREKIERFYTKMETPVDAEKEVVGTEDVRHLFLVGTLAMLVGGGLFFAAAFPNPLPARITIALTALFIFAIGLAMNSIGRSQKSRSG
jgi:Na+/proline symporter